MSDKAYNLNLKQLETAKKGKNANGKDKITLRAETKLGGRTVTRTVVAQGEAAKLIQSMVRKGASFQARCLISRAPDNDDGTKGGEYLTVVGLPKAKAA